MQHRTYTTLDRFSSAMQGYRKLSRWVYDKTKDDPSLYSIPVVGGWLYNNNRANDNLIRSQDLKSRNISAAYPTSDPGAIGNVELGGLGDTILHTAGRTSRSLSGFVSKKTYRRRPRRY